MFGRINNVIKKIDIGLMDKKRTRFSFYNEELSISINVPIGWDVVKSNDFPLALLAPEKEDFRVNVGFNLYQLPGEDKDKFEQAIQSTKKVLKDEYDQYQLINEEQVWIDGYPAYHQENSWVDEDMDQGYFQTLTLIYVLPDRLYEIIGTSLLAEKEEHIERLRAIIDSFRFINKT